MMSRIDNCKRSIVYIKNREAFVDLDYRLSMQHLKRLYKTFSQGQQIDAAPFASIDDFYQLTLDDQC